MTTATTKLALVLAALENIRSQGRGVQPLSTTPPPATAIPARPTREGLRDRIAPNGSPRPAS